MYGIVAIALSTIAITPVYNYHSDCNHVNCQTLSSHNYEINSFLLYLSYNEDRCYMLAPHW